MKPISAPAAKDGKIGLRTDYRKRAWMIFSLFLCLCIVSTAGMSYLIINDHLDHEVKRTNMSLLHQVDSKVTLVLRAIDNETVQLLQSKEVWEFMERDFPSSSDYSEYLISQLSRRLNGMLGSNDNLFSVELYSYLKRRLSSGNLPASGDLPEDYKWVRDFEKSNAFFYWMNTRPLTINRSSQSHNQVITLVRSYPMIHPNGYRKGAIAVNINERSIYDLIKDAAASNEGSIYIINAEGVVVSHEDKRMLATKPESDSVLAKVPLDHEEGILKEKVKGAGSTLFYYTSPYTGWKIVHIVPDLQLNQGMLHIRNTLLTISIVLILFALVMALAANRWTLKPINRLVQNISNSLQSHRLYDKRNAPDGEFRQIEDTLSHIIMDSDRMFKQMTEHKPAVKWRLVMDLLTGIRKNKENPLVPLEAIGYRLHPASSIVMTMEFDRKSEIVSPEDMHLYCYALSNVAEEMINAENRGVSVEIDQGMTAAIMSFEEAGKHNMLRAYAISELIKQYVEQHFKRTVTIGIGTAVVTADGIHQSYHEALEALKYKMVIGGNAIISIEDVQHTDNSEIYRLLARTDSIVGAVKAADRERARALAEKWFAELAHSNATSDIVRQIAIQFMLRLMSMLDDIDIKMPQAEENQLFEVLYQHEDVGQVAQYIIGIIDEAIGRIEDRRNNRERHEVVDRMLIYIQTHYGRSDLSLNLLADHFKQSVYHISRIFKERTEGNFLDYVMSLRMERAKELLLGSNKKIRDIAEEIGYTNMNSFVRIFKKSTGFTPTEFRERETEKAAEL